MSQPKKTSRVGPALKLGLLLGTGSALVAAASVTVTFRVMTSENDAFVQQSIGDTAGMLASHARSVATAVVRQFSVIGENQLKAFLARKEKEALTPIATALPAMASAPASALASAPASAPAGAPPATASLPFGAFEDDPDFLDVQLWTRESQGGPLVRASLAMNARYSKPSPELVNQVQALENEERALIEPAFAGHVVLLGRKVVDEKGMLLVAVPLGKGMVNEVAVGHVRLDRFQTAFRREGLVRGALVDGGGMVLAHPNQARLLVNASADGSAEAPLVKELGTSSSGAPSAYRAGEISHFGGFQRVGVSQLGVVATITESEARSGLELMKHQAIVFMSAVFCLTLLGGFLIGWRSSAAISPSSDSAGKVAVPESPTAGAAPESNHAQSLVAEAVPFVDVDLGIEADAEEVTASEAAADSARIAVVVLHGSIRGLDELADAVAANDAIDAINDFFTLAASRVRQLSGLFERQGGASFVAHFGAPKTEGNEAWRALRCALELRRDFAALNEARKVDGQRPLLVGMGVHSGRALAGRIGPAASMHYSVAGQVLASARALDQLSAAAGVDLLASGEVWQQTEGHFTGERRGEARLLAEAGLTQYHSVAGYRDEQGKEVIIDTPYSRSEVVAGAGMAGAVDAPLSMDALPPERRWLVNNGSQILGPLIPAEIAFMLFSQEMDFDSECWVEGTGKTAQLSTAGVFGGSDDDGATIWVFDGTTIHGPLSKGFLLTALKRGAIAEAASFICESSTIKGWKPLQEWRAAEAPVVEAVAPVTVVEVPVAETIAPVVAPVLTLAPPPEEPPEAAPESETVAPLILPFEDPAPELASSIPAEALVIPEATQPDLVLAIEIHEPEGLLPPVATPAAHPVAPLLAALVPAAVAAPEVAPATAAPAAGLPDQKAA